MQIDPNEYTQNYAKAVVLFNRESDVEQIASIVVKNKSLYYDPIEAKTGIPWWCVGAIHNLEASLRLDRHLHNGDSLMNRTHQVPVGRPVAMPASGHFPYTWVESAIDALTVDRWLPAQWDLPGCFEFLERYNGLGYRIYHPKVADPYLWSFTSLYRSGMYMADKKFDENAVSKEVGAVALLKVLEKQGLVQLTVPQAH